MSGNTVGAYLQDFDHLASFGLEHSIEPTDITLANLQQLLKSMNDLGIAPTSQRRMIAGWRTFYRMLVADDALKDSPAAMLDLPVRPQQSADETEAFVVGERLLDDGELRFEIVLIFVLVVCGL